MSLEAISNNKVHLDMKGLTRHRLIDIFEKQIQNRNGGEFSLIHNFNNKFVYVTPMIVIGVIAVVAFLPASLMTAAIAGTIIGIYFLRSGHILLDQWNHKKSLERVISDVKNKYVELGIIFPDDVAEIMKFADDESIKLLLNAMSKTQQLAAYSVDSARTQGHLSHIDAWVEALNFDEDLTEDAVNDNLLLQRVLEMRGEKVFKLPEVDDEWDSHLTEQIDHYYYTHSDKYSFNELVEILKKHPDCDKLRELLCTMINSVNLESTFWDWKRLWEVMLIVSPENLKDRFISFARKRLAEELLNPTDQLNEYYSRLAEIRSLPTIKFNLKNIRPLYEINQNILQQGILTFIRANSEAVRGSNAWPYNEMPEVIKNILYPKTYNKYY